jgi:PASTA domain
MRYRGANPQRRTGARIAVALLAAVAVVALCAAGAAAKVRGGAVTDPQDVAQAPGRDIEQARVSYNDLTGAFSIAVRFYGTLTVPASAADSVSVTIDFGPQGGGIDCGSARPNGATFIADTSLQSTGVSVFSPGLKTMGAAKKTVTSDRREIRISYTKKELAGMDLRCAEVTARLTSDPSYDQLDHPIFFPGPFVAPVCTVPKVVGKTLVQAKGALDRAGCTMGAVRRVRSASVRLGRVISQRPVAGKKLVLGSPVKLSVSRGRR